MMKRRPRSLMVVPRIPGGFLDNPPDGCPNAITYCPDPNRYETLRIVDYVRCGNGYCPSTNSKACPRRLEADRGRRARMRLMRGEIENNIENQEIPDQKEEEEEEE